MSIRYANDGYLETDPTGAFSPDGKLLVSGGVDRKVPVWNVASDTELHVMAGHAADVISIDFLHGGEIMASCSYDGTIKLWDVHTGECLNTWPTPGPYKGMNFTVVIGLTEAQKAALKALGAVEDVGS